MPYYIFGSRLICFDVRDKETCVTIENGKSYLSLDKLKEELQEVLKYLQKEEDNARRKTSKRM